MFIPVVVSMFKQSMIITIIMGLAAFWSTIYHTFDENAFGDIDMIWANVTTGVILVLMTVSSIQYGIFSWQTLPSILVSLASATIYVVKGYKTSEIDSKDYELWHGVWHLLAALSAFMLVIHPLDYRLLAQPYISSLKRFGKKIIYQQ